MSHKVELDIYSGPLELLLHLLKKDELAVTEISVAEIVGRYLNIVEARDEFDLDDAAEFLVGAAELLAYKSRNVNPLSTDEEEEEQEEDNEPADFLRQLLRMRTFKEAAGYIEELVEARQGLFTRGMSVVIPEPEVKPILPLRRETDGKVALCYASLLNRYMRRTNKKVSLAIGEIPSEEEFREIIINSMHDKPNMSLLTLFKEQPSRAHFAGVFFSVLELVKLHEIRIYQNQDSDDILIEKYNPEDDADGEDAPVRLVRPPVLSSLPPPIEKVLGKDGKMRTVRGQTRETFEGLDLDVTPAQDDDEDSVSNEDAQLFAKMDAAIKQAEDVNEIFNEHFKPKKKKPGPSSTPTAPGPLPTAPQTPEPSSSLGEARLRSNVVDPTPATNSDGKPKKTLADIAKDMDAAPSSPPQTPPPTDNPNS